MPPLLLPLAAAAAIIYFSLFIFACFSFAIIFDACQLLLMLLRHCCLFAAIDTLMFLRHADGIY